MTTIGTAPGVGPVDPTAVDAMRRAFLDDPRVDAPAHLLLDELADRWLPLADRPTRAEVVDGLLAELVGLGPLEPLLALDRVTDVLVTGDGRVWTDGPSGMSLAPLTLTPEHVALVVERAFRQSGSSVDRAHPIGEARLDGGARITVVVPPLAPDGIQLAIRRFASEPVGLAAFGDRRVAARLEADVRRRANLVVFGATGSGKTTLVGALARSVDPAERIVTIEDAAELSLGLPHVVRLEARPDNTEGVGGVDVRSLVRVALRLRPDRIVVGEVRGAEALDMVWAMSTGHGGSLSTVHARSAADALARLETFVMLADAGLPLVAVRAQVRAAVDVLVGVARSGARRSVVSIHEVSRDPADVAGVRPVFVAAGEDRHG